MANFDKYSATYEDKTSPEKPILAMKEVKAALSKELKYRFLYHLFGLVIIAILGVMLVHSFFFANDIHLFDFIYLAALTLLIIPFVIFDFVKTVKKINYFRNGKFSVVKAPLEAKEEITWFRRYHSHKMRFDFYGYGCYKKAFDKREYEKASVGDMFYIVVFDKEKYKKPILIYKTDNYSSFDFEDDRDSESK